MAVSSGTAALHLLLLARDVGPGDTVVCADWTFAGSAFPIAHAGATPVFIDAHPEHWTLDPQLLRQALECLHGEGIFPKALIAVDTYGQCADYPALRAICRDYDLFLIADAAEALGSEGHGVPAGAFADATIFSFNGNKIITTGGGGLIYSTDQLLVERCRYLATQAREKAAHYEHHAIGFNYRMSNISAAIGLGQLEQLPQRVAARRAINAFYREHLGDLPGLSFMPVPRWSHPNYWLTCILLDPACAPSPETLRMALESDNIESRPLWKPMHAQPVFANARAFLNGTADQLFRQGLSLPSGSALNTSDLQRIVGIIRKTF